MGRSSTLLSLERSKAFGDFYWFCKHVVGFKDMVPHVHEDLCDTLQTLDTIDKKGIREALILMPRGTFKSSITAQAFPIWYLLHNPNARIFIASATTDLAILNMRTIKSIVEHNSYFRQLFGDKIAKNSRGVNVRWNQDEILLDGRFGEGEILKEASITVGALGKVKAGSHYDVAILDDVVNHLNVATPQLCQKTREFYAQVQSLLDPGCIMPIVGTRYLYDDLYGYLLGNNETGKVIPDRTIIKKAIDENGKLLFPERLDFKTLQDLREKQGAYTFACQYLNEPTNSETAVFLREDFRYIGQHKEVPGLVTRFLLIDPSRGDSADSDYSALVVVSLSEENDVFVEYAQQHRLKPSQLADMIYDLHRLYKFDRIGIEQVGMQGIYDLVMDRVNRGGSFIPVVPVKNTTKVSKVMRIRRLEPYFKANKVYLMPGLTKLEDQLVRFPNIRYDDLVDAFSMLPDVSYTPNSSEASEQEERTANRSDLATSKVRPNSGQKSPDVDWLRWGTSKGMM